jgi:pyruvate/2-oxoglutarate dehydrogenase complex dihydrolipoamide acyltransferase (E2) component
MTKEYPLPKWGVTMEEGTIEEWLVNVGDSVIEGQILATVATDKITIDLESPSTGLIAALFFKVGADVAVGTPLFVMATDAADLAAYLGQSES